MDVTSPEARARFWEESAHEWRTIALSHGTRAEELEHENGELREIIRRFVGFVDSVRSRALGGGE